MKRVLILGGVRSGKSRFALKLAKNLIGEKSVRFIATANDTSLEKRIEKHKNERPSHWHLVEESLAISSAIQKEGEEDLIILECLTLWLNNLMFSCGNSQEKNFVEKVESKIHSATKELCHTLKKSNKTILIVANEVGLGILPCTTLGNLFADMHGYLNREVASIVEEVYLLCAGLDIRLK